MFLEHLWWGSQDPGEIKEGDMDQARVFTIPVRIVRRDVASVILEEESGRAVMPESLADVNPFLFTAEISSNRLDSYFTHMDVSTLRNFAQDANDGVVMLDSHDSRKLGIGHSLTGKYEEEGDESRVVSDFYTVPGIQFGGQHSYASTDDLILAIKTGLVRDVSVGFYGGDWFCDLCKHDYFSYECPHIAGVKYKLETDTGTVEAVATVTIKDAHLSEVSAVFDGATPGAAILKAQQELDNGRLDDSARGMLERQYSVRLVDRRGRTRRYVPKGENDSMDDVVEPVTEATVEDAESVEAGEPVSDVVEETSDLDAMAEEIDAILESDEEDGDEIDQDEISGEMSNTADGLRDIAGILPGVSLEDGVRRLVTRVGELEAEVARLQPLADQGRAYREELIDQALVEGVRALGKSFPEETYRGLMETATLDQIKAIRDTFATQSAKRFPGGRQTESIEEDEDGQETPAEQPVPDGAYSS